jgi:hypothetical protein
MSPRKYDVRLTEEVARFAFEVYIDGNADDWFIAFTNPTAGPWKTLKVPDSSGRMVEVYRFFREEERPDVVLVSDRDRVVLIIEAKDKIAQLAAGLQPEKSSRVVAAMRDVLSSLADNPLWSQRASYQYIGGLLWGNADGASGIDEAELLRDHQARLARLGFGGENEIIGFEVRQDTDGNLGIRGMSTKSPNTSSILVSLGLES